MSTEIKIPLWTVLYIYIRTPRDKYMVDTEYLSDLIDWLEPIEVYSGAAPDTPPLHFITVTNIQRYLAHRLNTNVEAIHWTLKYEVYLRLGDNYEF